MAWPEGNEPSQVDWKKAPPAPPGPGRSRRSTSFNTSLAMKPSGARFETQRGALLYAGSVMQISEPAIALGIATREARLTFASASLVCIVDGVEWTCALKLW